MTAGWIWMFGSVTATPSISPNLSSSAAASAAPAPLETEEAMTVVQAGVIARALVPEGRVSPFCSLSS